MHQRVMVGLGEVLWDIFGQERHVGGAPFNFTYHAAALGAYVATQQGATPPIDTKRLRAMLRSRRSA